MADIRPFRAVMPSPEYSARAAALPYDVYSREEAALAAAKDPISFLNIDRPETQFEPGHDMYAPDVYEKAAQMLAEELENGIYREDDKPCYYIYQLTMNGRTQTGITACASIDDYCSGIIKKHENTREDKLQDRIRHVDVTGMQTGPIFLAYRQNPAVAAVTAEVMKQEPLFDFCSEDGIGHRGWRIEDSEQIGAVRRAFAGMDHIYIADGHHRAESAVRAGMMRRERHPEDHGEGEFNYFLSVLFPDEELMIMDYNRVVRVPDSLDTQQLLGRLEEVCEIRKCTVEDAPTQKGMFQVYREGQWYLAQFRPEVCSGDPVGGLDVSILQDRILAPVFGIEDPKTDERIAFVGGIRGAQELQRRADLWDGAAFRMYPTSISELMNVADSGLLMPPKSTWFEPKLRSGLFLHKIGQ